MRVAMYARVSRLDQEPDNQLLELQRYVAARGWDAVVFVEHGVSGAKDRRPCTNPAEKLQLHILAALAEFERARDSGTGQGGPSQG